MVGLIAILGLIFAAAFLVASSRLPERLKLLIYAALLMRAVGSWIRYTVLFDFYGGTGDARAYYRGGVAYAERFWQLDFSPFYDSSLWLRGDKWWGTQFVYFPSGIVQAVFGADILGAFIVFSLLSFLGLVGFAVAFRRSFPEAPLHRYVRWIWFFPSLWYWPSSVGKEAIVLLGIGLCIWGFAGFRNRISWPLLAAGIFLVFGIRPQVAAVVIFSLILGHWLSLGARWSFKKAVQGALLLAVGLWGIWLSMHYIGVGGFDIEGVQDYMEGKAGSGGDAGSGIDEVEVGLAGVPLALLNILFRPFPWEAHNLMAIFSSLEIWAFWGIVCFRRKSLAQGLRHWRSHRLMTTALVFVLFYSVTLGMVISNMGIIARQRVFLFPFFFLLLEAGSGLARRRVRAPQPVPYVPQAQPPRLTTESRLR
ncbi:MAG: hypothetical protein H0U67_10270 [Gemmatimonadetes bacterium]|nr:hypothetical protein [Gemmatimonadota bacterium]